MKHGEIADMPELDALAGEAAAVDQQIAPAAGEQIAQQVDRLAEAKTLIAILKPLVMLAFQVVKDAPESEWEALTQPAADCLAFYDVDVSKWLAHPLAGLAFAAVPLVMRGVNNWQASQEKKLTALGPEPDKVTAPASAQSNVAPRA